MPQYCPKRKNPHPLLTMTRTPIRIHYESFFQTQLLRLLQLKLVTTFYLKKMALAITSQKNPLCHRAIPPLCHRAVHLLYQISLAVLKHLRLNHPLVTSILHLREMKNWNLILHRTDGKISKQYPEWIEQQCTPWMVSGCECWEMIIFTLETEDERKTNQNPQGLLLQNIASALSWPQACNPSSS